MLVASSTESWNFLPCKKWKIVVRYNCLRSPYFEGDVDRLLRHIAEPLMLWYFLCTDWLLDVLIDSFLQSQGIIRPAYVPTVAAATDILSLWIESKIFLIENMMRGRTALYRVEIRQRKSRDESIFDKKKVENNVIDYHCILLLQIIGLLFELRKILPMQGSRKQIGHFCSPCFLCSWNFTISLEMLELKMLSGYPLSCNIALMQSGSSCISLLKAKIFRPKYA